MIKCLPFYLFAIACIISTGCSRPAPKKAPATILEGKKVDVSSIFSKKRESDLVDALYEELVKNSEELQTLEAQIKNIRERWPDSVEAYNSFNKKNTAYYDDALKKTTGFSDSIIKQMILAQINQSRDRYRDSTQQLAILDSLINRKAATIKDLHSFLKLVKTIPVIEDFQQSNRPSTNAADSMNLDMEKFIIALDSVIIKHTASAKDTLLQRDQ